MSGMWKDFIDNWQQGLGGLCVTLDVVQTFRVRKKKMKPLSVKLGGYR
jgi:hypothetical protein